MEIKTSFGTVYIESEYQSEERCKMDGYDFVENTTKGPLYKKDSTDKPYYALITGF